MTVQAQTALLLAVYCVFSVMLLVLCARFIHSDIGKKRRMRLIVDSVLAALSAALLIAAIVIMPAFVSDSKEEAKAYRDYQALLEKEDVSASEMLSMQETYWDAWDKLSDDKSIVSFLDISRVLLLLAVNVRLFREQEQTSDAQSADEKAEQ